MDGGITLWTLWTMDSDITLWTVVSHYGQGYHTYEQWYHIKDSGITIENDSRPTLWRMTAHYGE